MVKLSQGDIIKLDFNPQAGHEQAGRRPAVVVSSSAFNRYSKTVMVCPITRTDKDHPFHVKLTGGTKTTGVILCDQLKTLDVAARGYEYVEKAPDAVVLEIRSIISGFLEEDDY